MRQVTWPFVICLWYFYEMLGHVTQHFIMRLDESTRNVILRRDMITWYSVNSRQNLSKWKILIIAWLYSQTDINLKPLNYEKFKRGQQDWLWTNHTKPLNWVASISELGDTKGTFCLLLLLLFFSSSSSIFFFFFFFFNLLFLFLLLLLLKYSPPSSVFRTVWLFSVAWMVHK